VSSFTGWFLDDGDLTNGIEQQLTAYTSLDGSIVLDAAWAGKTLYFTKGFEDDLGNLETSWDGSSTTGLYRVGEITAANTEPSGILLITGTATQGQVLTADASGLSDPDGVGAFSYVWKADGTPISGATGSTYTLTQAEVGKTVTVTASYTDGGGTVESVQSSATSAVANVNDDPTGTVTITGTVRQSETVTANVSALADADGLGTLSYQWKADGTNISGATSSTYTLTQDEVGKVVTVAVSYTDGGSASESVLSTATAAVENVNDNPTGTVTITGTPTQGQTLTANNTLADADGLGTLSYVWKAAGSVITGATASTYTLTQAEVGKAITVEISYTDNEGTAETVASTATAAVANVNDDPTGSVTITGTASEGEVLTANTSALADADGLGTLIYQWKADGTDITGATASTYTLTQDEVGKTITVAVSYTDGQGTPESVLSSATTSVTNVNTLPTGNVAITGTATQGGTLTADTSALDDADGLGTLSYQWKADGTDITGATASTYTLTQDEVGKVITVAVSYTDGEGTSESVLSTASAAVTNTNDPVSGAVLITGTATQGQVLTADASGLSDPDGVGAFSYVWKADGTPISGATGSTYTLTQAEVGKTVTVTASYTDGGGTVESVQSSATSAVANVNDDPTGTVTITGTVRQSETVTANVSALADADGLGTLSYQWKADGTNISGATSSTYTLTQDEVGKVVTVAVSYTDGGSASESVLSTATAAVENVNDNPTGTVTITGTPTQGQTLTANNTLADADGLGTLSYVWKAAGSVITGATASTYTLTQAEVGKAITVEISYTDNEGTAETVASTATAAVANVNDDPTGSVTITGTASEGEVLTANTSALADADGLGTLIYQWKADGTDITGATASTYTLTQDEVGKTITVAVSYTDGQGTPESVLSSATTSVTNVNTLPTGNVAITGTATQGGTLTADTSALDDADGLGTLSYQWKADGTDITGATASTYTLTQDEVGKVITVAVSYTDGEGTSESVLSTASAAVTNTNDPVSGAVLITGTATQGQVLTADASGLSDPDGVGAFSYVWKADGTPISGATGSTYTLTQAEVGKTVTVTASYTDGGGTVESVQSSATSAVANVNDDPTGTVTITGTVRQSETVTANVSALADADGLGTLSYQWKADGTNISGATSSTYTLTQDEVGKVVTVAVSYTDGGSASESVLSTATAAVENVNDNPTGTVTITGTPTQGQTLTANNTLADADGLGTLSYVWKAAGSVITGATASTYTLTQAEVGKAITVEISYTDNEGTAETVASTATAAVANVNDDPTGSVTITGTASEGEVLTANTSALADADGLGTLIYQWKADGTDITGATASTYTLTQDEGSKTVSVAVSFIDGFGFNEVVESEATDPINRKPIINQELPTFVATEGSTETRDLAGQIFTDLDEGAILSTSVSQVNGDTVPEWLNINFDTGLISATPTAGSAGLYKFRAVAEDEFGALTSQTFSISVIEDSP
jgi:predicted glycoside hydrolase/deacetylase ChbG (UPF0249 family)